MQPSELATGKWRYVLPALGVQETHLKNKHGPCPICGGKDRFRFDDKDGKGTWICNQCGAGDGYAMLQKLHGWGFKDALAEVRKVVGDAPTEAKVEQLDAHKMASIRRTWEEARQVVEGDPVWRYLRGRIGCPEIPPVIRYHPNLAYRHPDGQLTFHPAMVAKVVDARNLGVTLHRTYLTETGCKASVDAPKKLMSGKPIEGASIRLFEASGYVGIAEGIETALAASYLFQEPVWSVISSSGMKSFVPPAGIEAVTVYGDNDPKFGGQAAAYALAHKLSCVGVKVKVRIPTLEGWDWADELTHA